MRLLIILSISFFLQNAYCQSITPFVLSNAGASELSTDNIQLDWTLGEVGLFTMSDDSLIIVPGFQESAFIVTDIEQLPLDIGQITVFPNPVEDRLSFKSNFNTTQSLFIQVFDLNGKILLSKKLSKSKQSEGELNFSSFAQGVYLLRFVISGSNYIQTFKIQKVTK